MNIQLRPQVSSTLSSAKARPVRPVPLATDTPTTKAPTSSKSSGLSPLKSQDMPGLATAEEQTKIEKAIETSSPQTIQKNAQGLQGLQVNVILQSQTLAHRVNVTHQTLGIVSQLGEQNVHEKTHQVQTAHNRGASETQTQKLENRLTKLELEHENKEVSRQYNFLAALRMPDPASGIRRMELAQSHMKARSHESGERFALNCEIAGGDSDKIGLANQQFKQEMQLNQLHFLAEKGSETLLNPLGTGGLGEVNTHRTELMGALQTEKAQLFMQKAEVLQDITKLEDQKGGFEGKASTQVEKELMDLGHDIESYQSSCDSFQQQIAHRTGLIEHNFNILNQIEDRLEGKPDKPGERPSTVENDLKNRRKATLEHRGPLSFDAINPKLASLEPAIEKAHEDLSQLLDTKIRLAREDKGMRNTEIKRLVLAKDGLTQGKHVNDLFEMTAFTEEESELIHARQGLLDLKKDYLQQKTDLEAKRTAVTAEYESDQSTLDELLSLEHKDTQKLQSLKTKQRMITQGLESTNRRVSMLQEKLQEQVESIDFKIKRTDLSFQYHASLMGIA